MCCDFCTLVGSALSEAKPPQTNRFSMVSICPDLRPFPCCDQGSVCSVETRHRILLMEILKTVT